MLSVIPTIIWLTMMPLRLRFGSLYAGLTSLGQLMSLTGMPLFAVSLFLSGRFKFLEDYFGGMNRVYIVHHIIGGTAFLFLMAHPLFLAVTRAMISFKKAAFFFLPSADWSINFGIIAFYSLMLLLILTYYVKLPYQVWRLTHKFLGASFFFGGLHVFFINSDVARNYLLKYYILGISTISLAVYVYRTLLFSRLVKRYDYIVDEVRALNEDNWEIVLSPKEESIHYIPGQFIFIGFEGPGVSDEIHPFSINSSPKTPKLTIIMKALGDYTKNIGNLKPGTVAKIEGPYGKFYPTHVKGQVWIAGGIGVTPFLSMARSLKPHMVPVDLYYVVHDAKEAVYVDELLTISRNNPEFRVCLYNSAVEKKRLTAEMIATMSGKLNDRDIFICGPPPMMKSLRTQLVQLKVKQSDIHTEEFTML